MMSNKKNLYFFCLLFFFGEWVGLVVDDGIGMIGYIFFHPGNDRIPLAFRETEVGNTAKSIPGVANCVQVRYTRFSQAVADPTPVIGDAALVVDDGAVELEIDVLFAL